MDQYIRKTYLPTIVINHCLQKVIEMTMVINKGNNKGEGPVGFCDGSGVGLKVGLAEREST